MDSKSAELRLANLLGAFALVVSDRQRLATEMGAALEATAPTALVAILSYPGLSVGKLSSILSQSHSGTVRVLDRLQQAGLIRRSRSDKNDGRTVYVSLTSEGEKRVKKILEERRETLLQILTPLSPPERRRFCQLLEKLLYSLGHTEDDGYVICRLCDLSICPLDICPVTQGAH
jgi:MarR family transcriptional repressor of emrRAB